MNLKEAFQAQNKIGNLFEALSMYLDDEKYFTGITEKHFRSKAAEGQPDDLSLRDKPLRKEIASCEFQTPAQVQPDESRLLYCHHKNWRRQDTTLPNCEKPDRFVSVTFKRGGDFAIICG